MGGLSFGRLVDAELLVGRFASFCFGDFSSFPGRGSWIRGVGGAAEAFRYRKNRGRPRESLVPFDLFVPLLLSGEDGGRGGVRGPRLASFLWGRGNWVSRVSQAENPEPGKPIFQLCGFGEKALKPSLGLSDILKSGVVLLNVLRGDVGVSERDEIHRRTSQSGSSVESGQFFWVFPYLLPRALLTAQLSLCLTWT